MVILQGNIQTLYQGSPESRQIEFKRGFEWKHRTPKSLELIKTVLSMYNTPEGGDLILGIEQKRNDAGINYTGLKKNERRSLEKNEEVMKDIINSYSTIGINPQFIIYEDDSFRTQKSFLVIRVPHYEEYPTLAKKDGTYKSSEGKFIYAFRWLDLLTRSLYPKFSSGKAKQEELNEIIELCAQGRRAKCIDLLSQETPKENIPLEDILKKFSKEYQKERSETYGNI